MSTFLEVIKEGEKLESNVGQRAAQIANFEEKYTAFIELINNSAGHSTAKRQYMLKEAEGTSDFPTLFGTVLERKIRDKYKLVTPSFDKYVKVGTQNDFRVAWDMSLYGNRALPTVVKERGEYQDDTLNDGKWLIALQKYGKGFGLSWEAVINDDLGAFSDIADDLVRMCTVNEQNYVTKLYAGTSGPLAFTKGSTTVPTTQVGLFSAAGTHPIDGGTFSNYVTATPLTATNLLSAITAFKSQKDFNGNPIMFDKLILVVPQGKEATAYQLLSNNLLIATALTTSTQSTSGAAQIGTTSENIITRFGLEVVVNPWLDIISGATYGPYSWYLFAVPSGGDAIKFNRLRGHETPEVCQKMSDKISLGGAPISPLEGDFDSDSIRWRVRQIFGGTTTDPRFAYGAQATT
jgi:hypothetical protein